MVLMASIAVSKTEGPGSNPGTPANQELESQLIQPPYEFSPSDPGVLVEIYLPKKANFQGTLYDTLVKGFHISNVVDHFKDPRKGPGIKNLLRRYSDSVRYLENEIECFPPVLFGYSMYEVDGVFFNSSKQEIQEERTQVVRIMFRPDLKEI